MTKLADKYTKNTDNDCYTLLGTVPSNRKPKNGEFRGRCFEDCTYRDSNNKCTNNNRMVNIVGMCLSWK